MTARSFHLSILLLKSAHLDQSQFHILLQIEISSLLGYKDQFLSPLQTHYSLKDPSHHSSRLIKNPESEGLLINYTGGE